MRTRIEKRIRKRLRGLRHGSPDFVSSIQRAERSGIPLVTALRQFVLDPKEDWLNRGAAARLLTPPDASRPLASLLQLFFTQEDQSNLWQTALTIEHLNDQAAVRPLIRALQDVNPYRRHAAARALGWIAPVGTRATNALIDALLDRTQPQAVRAEAAESLAYCQLTRATYPLISVLDKSDVQIRFWAVFALGFRRPYERGTPHAEAVRALERMLADLESPPTWWSVGREALASLASLNVRYQQKLVEETQRVLQDPDASPEVRRWAEFYGQ